MMKASPWKRSPASRATRTPKIDKFAKRAHYPMAEMLSWPVLALRAVVIGPTDRNGAVPKTSG